jgi:tetratricopeptide (TPR) repeat protein
MTTRVTKFVAVLALAALPMIGSAADATLRFLEERVRQDPLDFTAHNRLAALYFQQLRETGDLTFLERATREAHASLAAVPAAQNGGGLTALALAEFESHHFTEAAKLARQAFAHDPRDTTAQAIIGDALLELGDYAEAETIYRQLDSNPPTLARLSRLAEIKGDNAKAIELLQQAGDGAWYHIRLGELYFRTGQLEKAEKEYLSVPENYSSLDHLAELRAAQGQYDEAIALYEKLIARLPRAEFLQALGDVYQFQGKPAEAKSWHDRALSAYLKSVEQGNAHYYHHLAGFYCDAQENPVEALKWARKDLAIRHSLYAYDSLAWALYKNGDFTGAAEAMKKALALGTQDAHLLYHAAMIYSRAGELEQGRALLKQTVAVNPSYNAFHAHR